MAIVNFLFGNRVSGGFSIEGAVSFDAQLTIDEMHERSATVTEHPIENGSTISDHVIISPERLRLTGFVTDASPRDAERGATQSAFDALDAAASSGQLMQVITGRKTYQDMILIAADLPRERPDSMQFSLEFVQVRLVSPEVVEGVLSAAQVADADRDTLQPEIDQGQTRAGRVSPEQRGEELQSTLSRIRDQLNGEEN